MFQSSPPPGSGFRERAAWWRRSTRSRSPRRSPITSATPAPRSWWCITARWRRSNRCARGVPSSNTSSWSAAIPDEKGASTHRDDPSVWLFTSGSTGFPKAAVHKQRDFVFNALCYALPVVGYRASDVALAVPKLAFGYALGTNLLFPLFAGGSAVLFPEKATPERLFDLIARHRPTVLTAVPTAINAMVNSPDLE